LYVAYHVVGCMVSTTPKTIKRLQSNLRRSKTNVLDFINSPCYNLP
jgi:hypothetical protein